MVTWIASIATAIMDVVSGLFLNALGTDMLVMEEYFPFVTRAFEIMQYLAWCLLFLITVWELFKAFGGPITEAENPLHLIARSAIFAILIGYARPIFTIALDIARAPYTALMDASMDPGDFTFAGIENVLVSGLITTLAVSTVVGLLLITIIMLIIGWNYFKTLLLVVERYIIVGVLCYTSPLAFAMGGSKATGKVFQSWCRMVGAQLLLLVMNVWFLRAYNSSVGHFITHGGALTSGQGSIFLWLFCALAFLKTAQKFDSVLASLGLNLAQTCGHMGMELLMASRVLGGFGGKASRTAGSMFGAAGAGGALGAAGAVGAGSGMMTGIASKFKGNSYVRDAVVDGGSRMGAGGGIGFVGRAFGGMAARTGTTLTSESISSVAARHPSVSGSIGGNIANRSLANYMPHLSGTKLNGTEITGGQINTTAAASNGKEASVRMFNSAMYDRPDMPHSVVKAADGSQWYQIASGEGMSSFYSPSTFFTGDASETAKVKEAFPGVAEGTMLRSVDDGVLEATNPDGRNSMWYNSAMYQQPEAPHETVSSADGVSWYAMQPNADPNFETGDMNESTALPGGSDISVTADAGHISVDSEISGVTAGSALPDESNLSEATTLTGVAPAGQSEMNAGALTADGITPEAGIGRTSDSISSAEGVAVPELSSSGETVHVESSSIKTSGISSDTTGMSETSFVTSGAVESTDSGGIVSRNIGSYQEASAPQTSSDLSSGGMVNYETASLSEYNQAQFSQFMPGYEQQISSIDASHQNDGVFEVRHQDGTGTAFYDGTRFKTPRGEHQVYEDNKGGQWYAVQSIPTVERRPVYENGKAVYEGGEMKTVNVEGVKYKTIPEKYNPPQKRNVNESKPPRKK